MKKNLIEFYKHYFSNFLEAVTNVLIFLPHFFSVLILLKSLFSPWKNLVSQKIKPGFSLDEWLNRWFYNYISRAIGFFMRMSLLLFYLFCQILFFTSLPIIFLIYLFLSPLLYLEQLLEKPDDLKKEELRDRFIKNHLLHAENRQKVSEWFEDYYQKRIFRLKWWKLDNLLSFPPLATNWTTGYTPSLDQFSEELTTQPYQQKLKSITDREKEISEIQNVLGKSEEANVVIVGEEGVGKHTIVDALAKKIYDGKSSTILLYKRILKLNLEKILTQRTDQKQREELLERLFSEAGDAKNIIIFIDDLDKYIASGNNRVDLTLPLEKFSKTAKIQFIGITTPLLYEQLIFRNEKINRLFTKIDVYEVAKDEAMRIALMSCLDLENRYKLFIPYETVKNAVEKSDFYITSIPFPEKTINLLDRACAYVKNQTIQIEVNPEIIDEIISAETHVEVGLSSNLKNKLLNLETLLKNNIVNQENAVVNLSEALRRSYILQGKRDKPLATFLFLGPTGVGKTETAKIIAKVFFGSDKSLVRFDMSEYQSKNDVPQLIDLLANTLRERPYGVLLLDEIEKANHDLLNIFLTVLDEGYFSDNVGKSVNCKNLVIIATSNAASEQYILNPDGIPSQKLINLLVERKIFSPEFLNRFDGVIAFNSLDRVAILKIAKKFLEKIEEHIYTLYKVHLNVSDAYLSNIVENNYDEKLGARDMERVIRSKIEDRVAKIILAEKIEEGKTIDF